MAKRSSRASDVEVSAGTALRRLRQPYRTTYRPVSKATGEPLPFALATAEPIRARLLEVQHAYAGAVQTLMDATARTDAPVRPLPTVLTPDALANWYVQLDRRQGAGGPVART